MARMRSHGFKAMPLATLCMFLWTFVMPHPALAAVEIPAQTPLKVATTSTIDPAAVNVGDQVYLQVTEPVVIGGKTVIAAGARAIARVTQAKERGMIGIPAAIGLVLESVETADGGNVAITGSVVQEGKSKMVASIGLALICCLLFALMKGGAAEIPSGTTINANTVMKATVEV